MARIIQIQAPSSIGCGCYSEGVNDDVNKYVWTALHWGKDEIGPLSEASIETQIQALLFQYASLLAGMTSRSQTKLLADGILCLETNWHEPLRTSKSVERSIAIFDEIYENLVPLNRKNWRLNLLMLRASHDAFLYSRLCQETALTASALIQLETSTSFSPLSTVALESSGAKLRLGTYHDTPISTSSFDEKHSSLRSGLNIVNIKTSVSSIAHLYARVMSLCSVLYEQIGYQSSIGYGGQHRQRGAYFDLAWTPLGDVQYMNYVLEMMLNTSRLHDDETSALISRFVDSMLERFDLSSRKVLWYCSFGDESANECVGSVDPPTRSQPVHEVLYPYRKFQIGEDPVFFQRALTEFMDTSNDVLLKKIHSGRVPRAWRSCLTPIWPRTANLSMKFEMNKLLAHHHHHHNVKLSIRVTYLMNDLNVHGGDWEELGRRGMGTKLETNGGILVHDYIKSGRVTRTMLFQVPDEATRLALKTGTRTLFVFVYYLS